VRPALEVGQTPTRFFCAVLLEMDRGLVQQPRRGVREGLAINASQQYLDRRTLCGTAVSSVMEPVVQGH
jgi:hypothetical protein